MSMRRRGCLLWGILVLLLVAFVALWTLDEIYRWRGNLVLWAFKDSEAKLEMMTKKGWKAVATVSVAELDSTLKDLTTEPGFRVAEVQLRRKPVGIVQTLASVVCESKATVLLISPTQFRFATSFKEQFAVTTARERLDTEAATFAITANFRDPKGKPLGWVYSKGQLVNRPFPAWTGAFFVKGGVPRFGPKSLVDEIAGEIEEGTQGYPSVMKNHTVFKYVDLTPDKYFDGKRITYRALAGTRRDGTVVFVLSGDGGVMNVSEITALAEKLQVQHATLLDGGKALQYSIRAQGLGLLHFRAFNTQVDFGPYWMRSQRSPVYIVVKKK